MQINLYRDNAVSPWWKPKDPNEEFMYEHLLVSPHGFSGPLHENYVERFNAVAAMHNVDVIYHEYDTSEDKSE